MGEATSRTANRSTIPVTSGFILACLLALSWVTFDRVQALLETRRRVAHAFEVQVELEKLYRTVAEAESDVRGYLLIADRPSYARYLASAKTVTEGIQQVRDLTAENPRQKPLIDELQAAIDLRYRYFRRTVNARRNRSLDEALADLTRGPDQGGAFDAMNRVREASLATLSEERGLLQERQKLVKIQTLQAEVAFGMALTISVILISALAILSNRVARIQEDAANEERDLRLEIEQEVERTKAAEARLALTLQELEQSNEELQNFAFVASHDLQEPLRKIRAFSDRVRRKAGTTMDEESKDSLQRIEAAAERMQRLILDLLDLSRVTTKGRSLVRVDPLKELEEVIDDLQNLLEETGGQVIYQDLPTVQADPAQIRQLFMNLIANALKFRKEGLAPEVRIEASVRSDERIAFRLSDNGIGFEPRHADRIFVVFQRLHGRGEYDGSGIGLAIVRKIVERHGGTIEAQGEPGEGAAFLFDLPGEGMKLPGNGHVDTAGKE